MIACYHSNNNKEALSSFIEDIKPANFFTKYWILESPEEFLFLLFPKQLPSGSGLLRVCYVYPCIWRTLIARSEKHYKWRSL